MDKRIKLLKEYFEKQPSVILAFLFGSRVKGLDRKISDWDIAVYFKPEKHLELEAERGYQEEHKIWSDLVD
ncbi:MAG: nucleotidyltransferase domain-containing protein, partial [Candidatus Omnitrophica bacterium]|nr:nucleotidyltransferase domain-containing protein [Candidatus Omnitrophota bacterium]